MVTDYYLLLLVCLLFIKCSTVSFWCLPAT